MGKSGFFSKKIFNSKITSANTQKSEMWLGYFFGPCLLYMAYYAIAGTYLTQFYTDVLGVGGLFLTLVPALSKVLDAITNIVMGRIIDKTRTKQGKVRPWILASGIAIAITGCLLYMVPKASYTVQMVWIVVSYNLFFAFAFTIYNMSHALMVPLSTRNTKQRDGLAMLTSTGTTMLPGLLTTIILPVMIRAFGVGADSQGTWISMMSIFSILAIPATLIEYYFTKERVTEENISEDGEDKAEVVPFGKQVKACFSNRYWLIIMGFFGLYQLFQFISTNSTLYYCNWVLSNSVDGGTGLQVMVNAIGQAPLGLGILILWPLVRKFGKRIVAQVGFAIGAVLMTFFDVEKMMPQISADITARRRAEAEARGEVYISPEEKAVAEQERLDQLAEEKRLEELRAKCAKKGLNFEEEEKKYQEKEAAKAAKKKK